MKKDIKMKNKILLAVLTLLLSVVVVSGVSAQGKSGPTGPIAGLIADVKANKVGDIVTIVINEDARASNISNSSTSKSNSVDMTGDFGNSFLNGLTGTIGASSANASSGAGNNSSRGTLTLTLTATIQKVQEDGNFLIRGSREIDSNGEKRVTVVEGVVRPQDITNSNTISSALIADARIFHKGSGVVTEASRPGVIMRILNWIF